MLHPSHPSRPVTTTAAFTAGHGVPYWARGALLGQPAGLCGQCGCQLSARHSVSPSVGLLAAGTPAENTVPIRIQLQPGLSSVLNTGSWQSCYTEQLQFSSRCVIMLTESDATCSSNTDTPQTVTRCGLFYLHFLPVGSGKAVQNNLLRSVLSGELKVLISPHHTASGSSCH